MSKRDSSSFMQDCRQYVVAGGTVVLIAHTTKSPNADGSLRYQGTTDFVEDCDAAYYAQPLVAKGGGQENLIKLTRIKCRGPNPLEVAYAYSSDPDLSYEAKVASMRSIDIDDLDDYVSKEESVSDPEVMTAISKLIEAGLCDGKMKLAKAAAEQCDVSHKAAIGVLEQYTGSEPGKHLWNTRRGPRGVLMYELVDQTKPPT